MNNSDDLGALLRRDGLAEAQQITGQSYKEDKLTETLGFMRHIEIVDAKRKALEDVDDTLLSNDLDRYLRIADEEGFEVVLRDEFQGREVTESYYVLWNDADAILLEFDTSNGDAVNGGKFYYNVRSKEDKALPWEITSSGHYIDNYVWVGDHDCREALRFNIAQLREHGTFVKPWIEAPLSASWLLTYMDWDQSPKDHNDGGAYRTRVSQERIRRLPQSVLDATGFVVDHDA